MLLKKSALLGLALTLPLAAYADLTTKNNTHEYSTVKITSVSPNRCAAKLPDPLPRKVTPPMEQGGSSSATRVEVNMLCGRVLPNVHRCTAEIYMNDSCSGSPVATASLDLDNFVITGITPTAAGGRYKITSSGTNVILNYA